MMSIYQKPTASIALMRHLKIINENFNKLFGCYIVPEESESLLFDAIWEGDFVLVSHGKEASPVFNFGNKKALELFEMTFNDFTQLESKYSASAISRVERQTLLDKVKKRGFVVYSGYRISSTGKKFKIKNAKVFDLYDFDGVYYGQAALFNRWEECPV